MLLRSIDAAVVDEADPFRASRRVDVYDTRNGFREPPAPSAFPADFVARVRDAQRRARAAHRRRRRPRFSPSTRAPSRSRSAPGFEARPFDERQAVLRRRAYEPVLVVHRTMANPAFTSIPTLDADPEGDTREYGSLLSDRPDLMNMSAMGFARTCTPRAWLSTWSGLSSHADLVANVARIDEPTLVVHATRDREVYFDRDVRPVLRGERRERQAPRAYRGSPALFRAGLRRDEDPRRRPPHGRRRAVDARAVRMSVSVVVVYHSEGGRTRALAEAVARGARQVEGVGARAIDVGAARAAQDDLAAADAIVFGAPTYMGSVSAAFKAFMDSTAAVWALQGWRDKLAAGFTHSAAPSGDKLGTLLQLAVFAAQHGMIWVGLGLPPSYASLSGPADDTNRLGSHLGAMASSPPGGGARPAEGDLETCAHLGRRVAEHAVRWVGGRVSAPASSLHPATATWQIPPTGRVALEGVRRTNLRELAARPSRFEHHLTVVARAGVRAARDRHGVRAPLLRPRQRLGRVRPRASDRGRHHRPASRCGRSSRTRRRSRTSAATTTASATSCSTRCGLLHWPGRLRPPYEPLVLPRGMRRCGLSARLLRVGADTGRGAGRWG